MRGFSFFISSIVAVTTSQMAEGANLQSISSKPNIVIILADDQGYSDLGCFGAVGFETPNIDRLSTEGACFTDFYAGSALCSASRAALLTGCYPQRVSIPGALMPDEKIGLSPDETTLADMLKQQGYATGIFGKWHLGHDKKFLPLRQGFDEYFGLPYSNDMWPVDYDGVPVVQKKEGSYESIKKTFPPLPLIDGDQKVGEVSTLEDQSTLTTRYTEKAVDFIHRHKERPFFLYVPHSMPHVPLAVSDKFKGKSRKGLYGDVMMELDWSVGEIIKALQDTDNADNTLVVFLSDNGPWLKYGNHAGSAKPFREGKMTMWEGGFRVPCVMWYPSLIPAGIKINRLSSAIDLLPTIAHLTGAPLPERKIDGVDITPLLQGEDVTPRSVFWNYIWGELRGVRKGQWKLQFPHEYPSVRIAGKDGFPGEYTHLFCGLELYNLETDPGETQNVADQYPEIVKELQEVAEQARVELGDKLTGKTGQGIRHCGRVEDAESIQQK